MNQYNPDLSIYKALSEFMLDTPPELVQLICQYIYARHRKIYADEIAGEIYNAIQEALCGGAPGRPELINEFCELRNTLRKADNISIHTGRYRVYRTPKSA